MLGILFTVLLFPATNGMDAMWTFIIPQILSTQQSVHFNGRKEEHSEENIWSQVLCFNETLFISFSKRGYDLHCNVIILTY